MGSGAGSADVLRSGMWMCLVKWADPIVLVGDKKLPAHLELARNSQEPSGRLILPQGMYLILVTDFT